MQALFGLCRRLDIPILTHGSLGILANKKCIEENNPYSPKLWVKAVRAANLETLDYDGNHIPDENKLRVCIAHFADRFKRENGKLIPSDYLKEATEFIEESDNIYLDLSELSNWFTSDRKITNDHKSAFNSFVLNNEILRKRLMYGTDWHMPGASNIGSAYLNEMRDLIHDTLPNHATETMGGNAMNFFKLKKNQRTRRRIDKFLSSNGVDLEGINWRSKVDRLFSKGELV
jgi:hypothetical protein